MPPVPSQFSNTTVGSGVLVGVLVMVLVAVLVAVLVGVVAKKWGEAGSEMVRVQLTITLTPTNKRNRTAAPSNLLLKVFTFSLPMDMC